MTIMTHEEACEDINEGSSNCDPDSLETDDDGQLVIYTGIYRWSDGTYHDEQEDRLARALDIASGGRRDRDIAALLPDLMMCNHDDELFRPDTCPACKATEDRGAAALTNIIKSKPNDSTPDRMFEAVGLPHTRIVRLRSFTHEEAMSISDLLNGAGSFDATDKALEAVRSRTSFDSNMSPNAHKHVSGVVCPLDVDCDAVRCQNARNKAVDEFKK